MEDEIKMTLAMDDELSDGKGDDAPEGADAE